MLLDAVHAEADRHRLGLPGPRTNLELGVGDIRKFGQDAAMDLEEAVADRLDGSTGGVVGYVVALLAEREKLCIGSGVERRRRRMLEREADPREEPVLGAEHVRQRFAKSPLPLHRRAVEVL